MKELIMKIENYLHLYMGCDVLGVYSDQSKRRGHLSDVINGGFECGVQFFLEDGTHLEESPTWNDAKDVKLILRPLSDMSQDEMKEAYFLVFNKKFIGNNITHRDIGKKEERWVLWSGVERLFIYRDGDVGADSDLQHYHVHAPTVVKWQLSKNFDVFGLIKAGLAVDKTTLQRHEPLPVSLKVKPPKSTNSADLENERDNGWNHDRFEHIGQKGFC